MYCIKCGVELADSEKRCPLCGTPVFHPDLPRNLTEPPYPADRRIRREDVNRSGTVCADGRGVAALRSSPCSATGASTGRSSGRATRRARSGCSMS